MAKFCPECANPIIEGNLPFCSKCGARLPVTSSDVQPYRVQQPAIQQPTHPSNYNPPASTVQSISEPINPERSFYYSKLFNFVIFFDLFLCVILGIGSIGMYFDVSSGQYYNTFDAYMAIILLTNFVIDIFILNNKRNFPHTIDINTCWVKCVFGFLGIITIISGLYFFIISIKMKNAYDARIR